MRILTFEEAEAILAALEQNDFGLAENMLRMHIANRRSDMEYALLSYISPEFGLDVDDDDSIKLINMTPEEIENYVDHIENEAYDGEVASYEGKRVARELFKNGKLSGVPSDWKAK